jgi:hypothetical protein
MVESGSLIKKLTHATHQTNSTCKKPIENAVTNIDHPQSKELDKSGLSEVTKAMIYDLHRVDEY